jgi:hypothetical protein
MGNHDGFSQGFYETFSVADKRGWYSIQSEDCYFLMLNGNSFKVSDLSEQAKWVEEEMKKAEAAGKFKIAVIHQPFFSLLGSSNKTLKKSLVPLFEKYGVNIVFQGHEHYYGKITENKVPYMVIGGYPQKRVEKSTIEGYTQEKGLKAEYIFEDGGIRKATLSDGSKIFNGKNYVKMTTSKEGLLVEGMDEKGEVFDSFKIVKR